MNKTIYDLKNNLIIKIKEKSIEIETIPEQKIEKEFQKPKGMINVGVILPNFFNEGDDE